MPDQRASDDQRMHFEAIGREIAKNLAPPEPPGRDAFTRWVLGLAASAVIGAVLILWNMSGVVSGMAEGIKALSLQVNKLDDRMLYIERDRRERSAAGKDPDVG